MDGCRIMEFPKKYYIPCSSLLYNGGLSDRLIPAPDVNTAAGSHTGYSAGKEQRHKTGNDPSVFHKCLLSRETETQPGCIPPRFFISAGRKMLLSHSSGLHILPYKLD